MTVWRWPAGVALASAVGQCVAPLDVEPANERQPLALGQSIATPIESRRQLVRRHWPTALAGATRPMVPFDARRNFHKFRLRQRCVTVGGRRLLRCRISSKTHPTSSTISTAPT